MKKYVSLLIISCFTYISLVNIAHSQDKINRLASSQLQALEGDNDKNQTTAAIIQNYIQKQKYQEALALISTLSDAEQIYSVVSNLAQKAGRAGYYEVALAASNKIPNLVYRVQVLESLADAHLAVGQQQQAQAIVNQAVEYSKQTEDPPLTNWLEPWLATGQEEKVRAFAAKLSSDANEAAFNRSLLTHAYLNQGRYRQAFEFAKFIPDNILLPLPEYTDPKIELLLTIINQSLSARDFAFAKEVALTLTQKEDQVNALQIITRAYNKDENSTEAVKILERAFNITKTIELVEVVPERHLYLEYSNATILISLARDYVNSGEKQRGLELLALAAQSIAEFNQQQLSQSSNRELFYSANRIWYVAQEYIELGEQEEAAVLLEKAWQESLTFPGKPDSRVADILTIAQLEQEIGNFDLVKTITSKGRAINQTVTEEQSRLSSELKFANLLAEIGEQKEAVAILEQTVPLIAKLDDIFLLINSLAIYKKIDAKHTAIKPLVNQILQQIYKLPSDYEKTQPLENLVAVLADANVPQLAWGVVQQFQHPELQTNMLLTLARKYNNLNHSDLSSQSLNQALVTSQTISNIKTKDLLLSQSVGVFDHSSYGFLAPSPAWNENQIIQITQALSQPKTQANIFLDFAFNYAKQGKHEASAQTLTLAWQAASTIKQKPAWEDKLWKTLQASLDAEEYDFAEQIALAIEGVDYQITALRRVAQKYAIAKQKPQARHILSQAQQLANTLEPGSHKQQVLSAIANQINSQQ
ncbi:MAG: hypothetical protein F6K14_03945 [Symploca sp. SIO2C1]|nr:hypothetical protein [Symploca sp. SIO2C1]